MLLPINISSVNFVS